MIDQRKTCFMGSGKMGEALLKGTLAAHFLHPKQVVMCDILPHRLVEIADRYGVSTSQDARTSARDSQVVILSVKPQDIRAVLKTIREVVEEDHLLISIAAGVSTTFVEEELGKKARVVRVMPNTPAMSLAGISVVSPGRYAHPEDAEYVLAFMSSVGETMLLPEENQNAAMAIHGCGPAYFSLFIESLVDAGISMGLSKEVSSKLAVETMFGSARMLKETGMEASELRRMVTSPAGTTVEALKVLEENRFRYAVIKAVERAALRAREIGEELEGER
ncbi:MAG: Pyrroline-5-carboxylate reductase [Actinobacteria bacterium]|uniref:Pyrroline-5-carboxylate reductase n=4 Tax=Candidatus Hakubella thermalkaliphila TaxID=2754717 RepID=A0A6V8P502_9ACTN|nr:Pyrroline-5-carboxylate reductase [Actinomycetota bacterium]GFP27709.1 pyrroline-5-carboxylate reductase [Candidatus Hakubella thermalkaliphila]